MSMEGPRINPELDVVALAEVFRREGKVRVANVLTDAFAARVHECLSGEVPWCHMYYNHEGRGPEVIGRLSARQRAGMSEAQWQALVDRIHSDAASKYQSWYKGYDVLAARREGREPDLYLQKFLDFMGSDELFDWIRALSGDLLFNRVDCHACRYDPGHFLKEHADRSPFERRRMAYVFNFSRDWAADFGGLTHFYDEKQEVTDTFVPNFNSLLLFRVPIRHSVSMVSSFAPRPRLSITGWFTRYG